MFKAPVESNHGDLKIRIEPLDKIDSTLLIWMEGAIRSWNAQWIRTQVEEAMGNKYINLVFVDSKLDADRTDLVPGLTQIYLEELGLFAGLLKQVKEQGGTVNIVSTGILKEAMEEQGFSRFFVMAESIDDAVRTIKRSQAFRILKEAERRSGISIQEQATRFIVHYVLMQKDTNEGLDSTERAIVDGFKRSDLNGYLFIKNYGVGYISFETPDGHQYAVIPERIYNEKGIEIREDRGRYWLRDYEKDSIGEVDYKDLDSIFNGLRNILQVDD